MQTITLSSNDQMPMLGLGTWKSEPKALLIEAIHQAVDIGYRHFDCAAIYQNEPVVGEAFQPLLRDQMVKREDLWMTSKLWNSYHAPEMVEIGLSQTLNALQMDYLDLYLMHWPVAMQSDLGLKRPKRATDFVSLTDMPLETTWEAMLKLQDTGRVKNIGVSNFSIRNLEQLKAAGLPMPAVLQIECHPYLTQVALKSYCDEHNIAITAYSPLGSQDRPVHFKAQDEPLVLENPVIHAVASGLGATPAQVILAWLRQRGIITIPKSTHAGRLAENFQSLNVQLSDEHIQQINALNQNFRYVDGKVYDFPSSPYNSVDIWK